MHFLRSRARARVLSPSLPGRSDPARCGRAFYYLRRGPLKAMPGNEQRGPKEPGTWPTQINAASGRESSCVCVRAGGGPGTTRGPMAFYGFLTDHISRRRTTCRGPFVLNNKLANLHACTYAVDQARPLLSVDSDDLTGVS